MRLAPLPSAALSLALLGCAGRSEATSHSPSAATQAESECRFVDTSTPATITTYEEGGVTVHTFRTPDVSAGSATHVIETRASLVVVDTQLLRDYAKSFRAYVDGLGKPIVAVHISHGHPDHFFGLEYFEDVPSYALADTHEHIQQRHEFHLRMHRETERECDAVTDRVRFPKQTLTPGTQTIDGVEFIFEEVTRAEDNTQLVIKIPAAKTLVLQDLMATDTHGFTAGGMVDSWLEVLTHYRGETAYTHVLSGHGAPVEMEGIDTMIEYLHGSKEIMANATDGEQFVAQMKARFPDKQGDYLLELMATLVFPEDAR